MPLHMATRAVVLPRPETSIRLPQTAVTVFLARLARRQDPLGSVDPGGREVGRAVCPLASPV